MSQYINENINNGKLANVISKKVSYKIMRGFYIAILELNSLLYLF